MTTASPWPRSRARLAAGPFRTGEECDSDVGVTLSEGRVVAGSTICVRPVRLAAARPFGFGPTGRLTLPASPTVAQFTPSTHASRRTPGAAGSFWTWRGGVRVQPERLDPDGCRCADHGGAIAASGLRRVGVPATSAAMTVPWCDDPNIMAEALVEAATASGAARAVRHLLPERRPRRIGSPLPVQVQQRFHDVRRRPRRKRADELTAKIGGDIVVGHAALGAGGPLRDMRLVAESARAPVRDPLHVHLSEQSPARTSGSRAASRTHAGRGPRRPGADRPSHRVHATHRPAPTSASWAAGQVCFCPTTEGPRRRDRPLQDLWRRPGAARPWVATVTRSSTPSRRCWRRARRRLRPRSAVAGAPLTCCAPGCGGHDHSASRTPPDRAFRAPTSSSSTSPARATTTAAGRPPRPRSLGEAAADVARLVSGRAHRLQPGPRGGGHRARARPSRPCWAR